MLDFQINEDSNTTLVKVKLIKWNHSVLIVYYSNTTLVKVKFCWFS